MYQNMDTENIKNEQNAKLCMIKMIPNVNNKYINTKSVFVFQGMRGWDMG